MEADAQRGNERAEGAEKKITDIEEELRCDFHFEKKKTDNI